MECTSGDSSQRTREPKDRIKMKRNKWTVSYKRDLDSEVVSQDLLGAGSHN